MGDQTLELTSADREVQAIEKKRKKDNEKNQTKKKSKTQPASSPKRDSVTWQKRHRQQWDRSLAGMETELFHEVFPGTNSVFFWEAVPLSVMKSLIMTFTTSIFKRKCNELKQDIALDERGKEEDCCGWYYGLHWDQYDLTQSTSKAYLEMLRQKDSENPPHKDNCIATAASREDTRRPSMRACKIKGNPFDIRYQKGAALDANGVVALETIEATVKSLLLKHLMSSLPGTSNAETTPPNTEQSKARNDKTSREEQENNLEFFFAVLGTKKPGHQQLHTDNIPSSLLAKQFAKEGSLLERSIEVGYVLHMPLMKEGMALRVERKDAAGKSLEVISLLIPFGSCLVVRADVRHSGCYGSPGNKRLHAAIVPKTLQWIDTCLDFRPADEEIPDENKAKRFDPSKMLESCEKISKHCPMVSDKVCNKYRYEFNRSVQQSAYLNHILNDWEKAPMSPPKKAKSTSPPKKAKSTSPPKKAKSTKKHVKTPKP